MKTEKQKKDTISSNKQTTSFNPDPLKQDPLSSHETQALTDATDSAIDNVVFDNQVVDTLQATLGEQFIKLVNLFISDSLRLLAEMERCLLSKDFDGLAEAAHSLKGSSMNLGATSLTQRCMQLERAARSGDSEAMIKALPEVENAFQSFRQRVEIFASKTC